jgi:hypothetical protein
MPKPERVMEQKAGDHEYLHQDFHGALAYAIQYLDERFGPQATTEYLYQVADTCYAPLTALLQKQGLVALESHFAIYSREQGRFSVRYDEETLVLEVQECPAIIHLKNTGQLFTERYCESTVVVMDGVCRNAGYCCSCTYEPGQGRCVQKFWKER